MSTSSVATRQRPSKQADHKRLDIQGLRMVAVVAVFVNHISNHPQGAFAGVDVFFVISGFLITGLLVRDASRAGTGFASYIGSFYQRRARRILPAALTVLLVSWVAADLTFKGLRVSDSHTDILWALGFSANIRFAHIGTDYFQQAQPPSIVQHFWSLAVEEQFYVVWPLVVFLVIALIGRRRRNSTNLLLVLMSAVTVASFVYALSDSSNSPATAYFSTFARAWELGVGAILAVVVARFPDLSNRLGRARGPLALAGVVLIVVSFFVVDPNSGFPAPWGAFPVLATVLVIVASASASPWAWPLTNRVSVYVGEISYSLYLWHWPTIIILSALLPDHNALYYLAVVAASLGLSVFSFEFVETPLRTARQNKLEGQPRRRLVSAFAAGLLVVVAISAYSFRPAPPTPHFLSGSATTAPRNAVVPDKALEKSLRTSLAATQWPDFNPSLDTIAGGPEASWGNCVTGTGCHRGNGPRSAVILGDSIAMAWMPAIKSALGDRYTVHGFTLQECPAADVTVTTVEAPKGYTACDKEHHKWIDYTAKVHPSVIFLASTANTMNRLVDGQHHPYEAGLESTITQLEAKTDAKIVTLSPPPEGVDLPACDVTGSVPANCVAQPNSTWRAQSKADHTAAKNTKTTYLDTSRLFCVIGRSTYCPAFTGTTPQRFDKLHLTVRYAHTIGPDLGRAVRRLTHIS